jgi:hypothetical protein
MQSFLLQTDLKKVYFNKRFAFLKENKLGSLNPGRFLTELKNKFRNTQPKPSDLLNPKNNKNAVKDPDPSMQSDNNSACLKVSTNKKFFFLLIFD